MNEDLDPMIAIGQSANSLAEYSDECAKLSFQCPSCAHDYTDALELLDNEQPHHFKCEKCSVQFSVLVNECGRCGGETVITWQEPSSAVDISLLYCSECGADLDTSIAE